nr:hypothetical protein [Sodalis glossinidius]
MSLSGCITTPAPTPSVPFQAGLLVKCPERLPRLDGTTGKALSGPLLDYLALYPPCAARHNQLVDKIYQREALTHE